MNIPITHSPPLNQRQYSLAMLVTCMTVVAVVIAVLPYPFVAFYVLLITLFGTALLSRFGPVGARSFWRWFSACGWLYVFAASSLIDAIESTVWWRTTRVWLEQNNPVGLMWSPEKYLMSIHSLIAISVAIVGGVLIPLLGKKSK